MRRLVELHKQTLSRFLEQRHDLLLVVPASDADAVILLQLTSELDEASDEDLFVTLGGEFLAPDSYALAAAELFSRQHALAAAAVRDAGRPPLPELPPRLLAPELPGGERLRALAAFAHELLPREARRLVLVVSPTLIADRTAYLALLGQLLPRPEREPWMARLRIVMRDVPASEASDESEHPLSRTTSARVQVAPLDFSQAAIRDSLAATAADESAPPQERMQALLAAAIVDGVHGEHARALAALDIVLAYHQGEKNVLMQAVTVNAMGEVCQVAGSLDRAQHWFECALPLAAQSENAFVLATVAKNLGSLCALTGDHENAVCYFDGLAQIAPKMLDNETLSWALQQRGASEAALGKHDTAIATWQSGADLCRNTDHPAGLRGHLVRLSEAYGARNQLGERQGVERELASLPEVAPHV
jgi:tetratricopeptide (TPR) repeat protein